MKKVLLISVLFFSFVSCRHLSGSGNIITETKNVERFNGISAGSGFDVEVHIGSPASVVIEADDNIMKLVKVRVEGDVLNIHMKNGLSLTNAHLKAKVTVPSLNYIESSGAATVQVLDEIKDDRKIKLHASGAASLEAKVDAPEIETESSGAADVRVSGRTRDLRAHASGGAKISAGDLMSENADAEASGAATVHVYASVKLKADASGAGNIYYKGDAAVQPSTSGAGNVRKED